MSTNVVHVLTIIGDSAEEVEAACENLLARIRQRNERGWGSEDWSAEDHHEIGLLCQTLANAARNLPVVYYVQYLDPWTVADGRFRLVTWPDGKRRQVCGDRFGLVYYPSRFAAEYRTEIERLRQTNLYRDQLEDRWYLDHFKEAIESALWLKANFLVVSISENIGPSRLDEDMSASLRATIDLHHP